jgi:hypothetical protein
MSKLPRLTRKQLAALKQLWDATDEFAMAEESSVDQDALIAARNAMGTAFPERHPIYSTEEKA